MDVYYSLTSVIKIESPSTSKFTSVPSYHPNSDTTHSGKFITYSPVTGSTSTVVKFSPGFFCIRGIPISIFVLYRKTPSSIKSSQKQDFIDYRDPWILYTGRRGQRDAAPTAAPPLTIRHWRHCVNQCCATLTTVPLAAHLSLIAPTIIIFSSVVIIKVPIIVHRLTSATDEICEGVASVVVHCGLVDVISIAWIQLIRIPEKKGTSVPSVIR